MTHFNKNFMVTIGMMAISRLHPGVLAVNQDSSLSENNYYDYNHSPEVNEVTSHELWKKIPEIDNNMISQIETLLIDFFDNKETQEKILAYISSGEDENNLFGEIENPVIRDALKQVLKHPVVINYLRKLLASNNVKEDLLKLFKDKRALEDMRKLPNPDESEVSIEHLSNNKNFLDLINDLPKDEQVQKIIESLISKFGPFLKAYYFKEPEIVFDKNEDDQEGEVYDYPKEYSTNDRTVVYEQDEDDKEIEKAKDKNDKKIDYNSEDDSEGDENSENDDDEEDDEDSENDDENSEAEDGDKETPEPIKDSQYDTKPINNYKRQEEPSFSYDKVTPTNSMRTFPNNEYVNEPHPAYPTKTKPVDLDKAMDDYLKAGPSHTDLPPKIIWG